MLSLVVSTIFASQAAPVIYMNRCTGGCTVIGGTTNDARANESTVPSAGTYTLDEFKNAAGQSGAAADAEWEQVLQCVREQYSPFGAIVTDQAADIAGDSAFVELMVGGTHDQLGEPNGVLVIAPVTAYCSPSEDTLGFIFANEFPSADRLVDLCNSIAEETGELLGLEHTDAPGDVMDDFNLSCGGTRFFRNALGSCKHDCRCGPTQDSYQTLLSLFGAGVSTIPPPTASITYPSDGATIPSSTAVHAFAGSPRGVTNIELWLNGYRWLSVPGAACGMDGQPDPSAYTLDIPLAVPDSILDITVKAFDDVGTEADASVTVTKGAPCADASTCATGQLCDQGRCFWNAPTGELGASCTYDQFCVSGKCDGAHCTQSCVVGVADSCPSGFDCIDPGECSARATSGCRSTGGAASPLVVLLFILRRRRQRS